MTTATIPSLRLSAALAACSTAPPPSWASLPHEGEQRLNENTMTPLSRPRDPAMLRTPQGKAAFAKLTAIEGAAEQTLRVGRAKIPTIKADELRTPLAARAERQAVVGAHFAALAGAATEARRIAAEARGAGVQLASRLVSYLEDTSSPARTGYLAEVRATLRSLAPADRERIVGDAVRRGDMDVLAAVVGQPAALAGDPATNLAGSIAGASDANSVSRKLAELVSPDLAAAHVELSAIAKSAATTLSYTSAGLAKVAGIAPPIELDAAIADIARDGIGNEYSSSEADRVADRATHQQAPAELPAVEDARP